jgi:hypothetical protein
MPATTVPRYVHKPFSFTHDDEGKIQASCDKDGKVTITVMNGEEYDEVVVPASLIIKLRKMLWESHKIKYVDKETLVEKD